MTHPTMRKTFVPGVPESITRDQLIAATRALGLEPYTVHSIQFDATAVHVTIGLYSTPDTGQDDETAFLVTPRPGLTITERITVKHPGPFDDGVMPV